MQYETKTHNTHVAHIKQQHTGVCCSW